MKPAFAFDQLSLFDDLGPDSGRPQAAHPQRGTKTASRPVAPSRLQSRPPEASAAAALLTTQEAAELLHVHPRTVQRLVERGELIAVHLGAAVRFDRADLADLTSRLKGRAAGPPSARTEVTPARGRSSVSFAERLRSQQDEHRAA
jgi:excisionase family DNA binding protein